MISAIVVTRHPLPTLTRRATDSRRVLIVVGIALCLTGALALVIPSATGIAADLLVGWLLLALGGLGIYSSLSGREPRQRWRGVLLGAVAMAVGAYLVLQPLGGTALLAGLIAGFLLVDGVLGAMAAWQARGTVAVGTLSTAAVVSMAFGLLMVAMLPEAAPWLLGVLIGVHLLIDGLSSLLLARALPRADETDQPRRP